MTTYGSLWPAYAKQWDHTQITARQDTFTAVAHRLVAAKDRYLSVQNKTGVPWYMIAVIHERESSQNWNTQLAQGDPLHSVSVHVPRGEGPYSTWEEGAEFALRRFKNVIDWRLEKILYYLEEYNGWGYHNHGVPSAYLWAGTNQYHSGKYIADGVWSSSAVDTQLGCVGLIKTMMQLDPSIQPVRETPIGTTPAEPTKPTAPEERYTWDDVWMAVWQVVVTLFGKKNI